MLRSLRELRLRQKRVAELAAAVLHHDPRQKLAHAREHLADFRARLDRCLERLIESSASRLGALDARLHSLSPLAVLDRGYALVLSHPTVRSFAPPRKLRPATNSPRAWPMARSRAASNPPPRTSSAQTQATRQEIEIMTATSARKLFGTDGIRAVAGESPLDPTTDLRRRPGAGPLTAQDKSRTPA